MISIIIVNHDTRERLRQTLDELVQVAAEWDEVVVVDAASSDGSSSMVSQDFPEHHLLPLESNVGFAKANNLGVAAASGDCILLLNSDAWPLPGTISKLSAALAADESLGLVAPRLLYPDRRRQFSLAPATGVPGEVLQKLRNPWKKYGWVHRRPPRWLRPWIDQDWFTAACVMVRRQAYEEVGGFDERFFLYFEDVDLCLRLGRAGWGLTEVGEAVALHVKGGSASSQEIDLAYRKSQLLYYRLHRPAWEQRLLSRRLRRKFGRVQDPELRQRLLKLLET
ncbi:MAG: glycosyltransferase family 2 protein [Thermoanaerobaculia bacterium]|nr:glycosyltransferase family 2 protein [Thermoanaerobaculia bacterium]